jgi:hypothetical protein
MHIAYSRTWLAKRDKPNFTTQIGVLACDVLFVGDAARIDM